MRTLPLPVAALLGGLLLLAGAAATTAAADGPSAASSIDGDETNASDDAEAGICMIGVDSPCNGEQWDGDARTNESTDSGTAIGGGGHGGSDSDALRGRNGQPLQQRPLGALADILHGLLGPLLAA